MSTSSNSELGYDFGLSLITLGARIGFGAAFVGMYLIVIAATALILCHRERLRRTIWWKTILILSLLAGSTYWLTMDILAFVWQCQIFFMEDESTPIQDRINSNSLSGAVKGYYYSGDKILGIFMPVVGTTILLFRVWKEYYVKGAAILPYITLLFAEIFGVIGAARITMDKNDPGPVLTPISLIPTYIAFQAAFSFVFGGAILCTFFILLPFFAKARLEYKGLLALLLMLYLGFLTIQGLLYYLPSLPGSFVIWDIFHAIKQQAFGILPTAILAVTELQTPSLFKDSYEESDQINPDGSTPMGTPQTVRDERKASVMGMTLIAARLVRNIGNVAQREVRMVNDIA